MCCTLPPGLPPPRPDNRILSGGQHSGALIDPAASLFCNLFTYLDYREVDRLVLAVTHRDQVYMY